MSERGEMWVHGNSVIVQYPGGEGLSPFTPTHRMMNAHDPEGINSFVPWSDLLGVRSGNGATFKGAYGTPGTPTTNWFHFSIPTPAITPQISIPIPGITPQRSVEGHLEITVNHVSMYYKTTNDPNVTIQEIAVSDAGVIHPVHGIEGEARLYGDHSLTPDSKNNWPVGPFTLRLGSPHGVLISVKVRFDVDGEITFIAAAMHYQVGP